MAIPVGPADVRRQLALHADDNSQNEIIQDWIADAAAWVENYTGHLLSARDVVQQFDGFARLRLRAWPIKPDAAVGLEVGPGDGAALPIGGARLLVGQRPATVIPPPGARWPTVASGTPVTVTVRAGYEAGDAVPGVVRRAMLVLISAYDQDREGGEVMERAYASARSLCGSLRFRAL